MGQRRFGCVLGEHGDAVCGPQVAGPVSGEQEVGATVERIVHLRPCQLSFPVDERESRRVGGGTFLGEAGHQGPIGRLVEGRSNEPCRNFSTGMGMAFGDVVDGRAVVDTDAMQDAPLAASALVGVEIAAVERRQLRLVAVEQMGDGESFTSSVFAIGIDLDAVVRGRVHRPLPSVVCLDDAVAELPGVADEDAMVVGAVGPVGRLHHRSIEPVDAVGVPTRRLAAGLDREQLLDGWGRVAPLAGHAVEPPSTTSVCPVTNAARSEARNSTARAT